MPDILDDAVKSIMKKDPGMSKDSAYGIAVSTLQKSEILRKEHTSPPKKASVGLK